MCDACKATGDNHFFKNADGVLYKNRLYQVFCDGVAKITLCRIHDIELFRTGELRFLEKNLVLANHIATNNAFFAYG